MRVYSIALPVVAGFSLLWRTSSSSSWKNTQVHPIRDLHLNGIRNPTLDSVLQKMWIPFVKIKHNFGRRLCNPYQKISVSPVVSNGSSQLFRGKNVIQIRLWFLKTKKTWLWVQLQWWNLDQFLGTWIRTLVPNHQSGWPTNTSTLLLLGIEICTNLHDEELSKFS